MFQNLADSSCADRAPRTVGAARRRRDRRLRAFLKHERMTVAMNLATMAPLILEVRRGECWCAGWVALGSSVRIRGFGTGASCPLHDNSHC